MWGSGSIEEARSCLEVSHLRRSQHRAYDRALTRWAGVYRAAPLALMRLEGGRTRGLDYPG
jgi:hypothetical protein